ncbi:choice-of-anchor Q domain-containing protein [Arenibaculum pallidiluteum]|uniref:choice-of-anchor Q domain-containing protein n=1 Tax=Arenibaculum pallidiluteum TaxID=2812559 RepID=UPI001A979EC4|nr:choice-of-anchor Q domain-containing protein [Arenibaculum pallidiluteum]
MADLYVSTSGSDSGSGTSSSPFRTIAKAAQAAQPGTTVHVAPGTYEGGFSTSKSGTASAPITFVSDVKWGAKIVPPASSGNGVAWNNSGDYVHIKGFEVDGTNHKSGTPWNFGIYTTGTGSVVEGNKVHDIATRVGTGGSSGGAGIEGDGYYGDTNIKLLNNVVYDIGAGVGSSGTIQGIYHTTTGEVSGNLIHNVAAAGISLWHDPRNIDVVNNTVFQSDMGIWVGAGDHVTGSAPADNIRVLNNLVYDNARYGIVEGGQTGTNNVYDNNLVYDSGTNWRLQNGLKHTDTITADPKFVNYKADGSGDYHLATGSPAINTGTSTKLTSTDLDGQARVQGSAPDIGAYEYKATTQAPTPTPTPTPTPSPTPTPAPTTSVPTTAPKGSWSETPTATKAIDGTVNNETLYGTSANEILGGNGGDDKMVGGGGHDTYVVSSYGDTIVEYGSGGVDVVHQYVKTYTLPANVNNLIVKINYGATATGNSADNIITGGTGNDVINGGGGRDKTIGGGGYDTFVLRKGQAHGDLITDFNGNGDQAGDVLRLEGYGTGAKLVHAGDVWTIQYSGGQETFEIDGVTSLHGTDVLYA